MSKIIQTRRGRAHKVSIPVYVAYMTRNMEYYKKKIKKNTTVTFLKTVSQNAPDCISAHISLKKLF